MDLTILRLMNIAYNVIIAFPAAPAINPNLQRPRGALEAPTITPLPWARDPPWSPLSSSVVSKSRTQATPLIESIVPHDQHTFTAVIPPSLSSDALPFENNDRDASGKQNDDPAINIEHPPNATLRNQGIRQSSKLLINAISELDETSPPSSRKATSGSQVGSPTPQQIDELRRGLLAYDRGLSVLSDNAGFSKETPSEDSIDSATLDGLSPGITGLERTQNPEIEHNESDLEHLTTLLGLLDIQPGTIHYNIILEIYEGARECAPQNSDVGEAQISASTSSTSSSASGSGTQSSSHPNKRSHQQCEDSDSEQNGLKEWKSSQPGGVFESSCSMSCLYYKVNPHIYSACAAFKTNNISRLGAHLKSGHASNIHCCTCCRVFKAEQQRAAHQPECRPTRGPCVCTMLPLSRTQGVDPVERWKETWNKLFPTLRMPKDPWWSENLVREQISLANLKRLWEAGCNGETNFSITLMIDILSEWVTTPPDHLPDLQDFKQEISRRTANSNQSQQHTESGGFPPAACTPRISESAGLPNQPDEQNINTRQADREPVSPPLLHERLEKLDSDMEAPVIQLDSSGITTLSPSCDIPLQDSNNTHVSTFDPGVSQNFEIEETQISEGHLTTGDYFHFDASEIDISNSVSDLWGDPNQDFALHDIDDMFPPGFFDSWANPGESSHKSYTDRDVG
ncbi:hypothetical protein F4678DRAFT_484561 [Xylaria arbuscula]|nr:hypothetical protein F4678DRAFT_484561 [Xylaria arbuscula]